MKKGFTLIELLVVVAIIAILAAIALPNFLEAQTRSKVSRVKADMRSVATALETYTLDNNHYPNIDFWRKIPMSDLYYSEPANGGTSLTDRLLGLTTPMAYISKLPMDIFNPGKDPWSLIGNGWNTFTYACKSEGIADPPILTQSAATFNRSDVRWLIASDGPSLDNQYLTTSYDPTNGTTSKGAIVRLGP